MKQGFVKGIVIGVVAGALSIGSVYAAAKTVQARLVSSTTLQYNGALYVKLNTVEQALSRQHVTYHWNGSALTVGASTKASTTSKASATQKSGIAFTNLVCKDDGVGYAEVDGVALNHDNTQHKDIVLIVSFFDKSGKLLGTGNGVILSVGAKGSMAFQTMSTVSYSSVASYRVQAQTMD